MTFTSIFGEGYELTGKDGKTYIVPNFTLEDYAKFVTWVQYKPFRDAQDADLPQDVIDSILEECKLGIVKEEVEKGQFKYFPIHLGSSVVMTTLVTVPGILKLLEIGLRKIEGKDFNIRDIINEEMLDQIGEGLLKANQLIQEKLTSDAEEESEKN